MRENFERAVDAVLQHEGGYVNHPADPGGATRYGITEAVARRIGYRGDMRDFPLDLAKRIYREEYWNAVRGDELPEGVDYAVFDAAVNSGVGQASRWLQRAVGAVADGIIGPRTMAAVKATNASTLIGKFNAQRLTFLRSLTTWDTFGKGWGRRVAEVNAAAIEMATT